MLLRTPLAGLTGLCFLLAIASPRSSEATPRVRNLPVGSAKRSASASSLLGRAHRRGNYTPAMGCSTDNGSSFIGVTGEGNISGGNESAVLGGYGNQACDAEDGVASGQGNVVGGSGNAPESFIGGGNANDITGANAFVGAGQGNSVEQSYGFVGGGTLNDASAEAAFVGAGDSQYLNQQVANDNLGAPSGNVASGVDSFVGAGDLNQVSGLGSFIGAGGYAWATTFATTPGNQVSGTDSFVGAGDQNTVAASAAFVGGGTLNAIASQGKDGVIAGGSGNKVTNQYATVSGGSGNLASGNAATVPGGYRNLAQGQFSFAAGFGSYATTDGSFVWSDYSSTAKHLQPSKANEFLVRSTGGVVFLTNAAETTGAMLAPGSGTWASASDRSLKSDVTSVDDAAILAKVAALPVAEWSYTSERGVRHLGPMAQDFYAAFRVGEDDRHITSIDEDGVALAAIKALHGENQGLHIENRGLHVENQGLHVENGRLRQRLARADARLASLERDLAKLAGRVDRLAAR